MIDVKLRKALDEYITKESRFLKELLELITETNLKRAKDALMPIVKINKDFAEVVLKSIAKESFSQLKKIHEDAEKQKKKKLEKLAEALEKLKK